MHRCSISIEAVLTAPASIPVYIFIIITGAVATPLRIQVDHGNHFRLLVALPENYSHALVILRHPFERIRRTRLRIYLRLIVIDPPVAHDLLDLLLRTVSTLHPATGVFGIFYVRYPPVKPTITVDVRSCLLLPGIICDIRPIALTALTPLNENQSNPQYRDENIRVPFFIHLLKIVI